MEVVKCRSALTFLVKLLMMIMILPSESLADHDSGSLVKTQLTDSENKSATRQLPWEVVRKFILQITQDTETPINEEDVQTLRIVEHPPPMAVISDEKTPNSEEKIVQLLQRDRGETRPVDENEFKSLSLPAMFEDWDINKDEWIDMEEMANVSGTTILDASQPFLAADLDGDDLINKDEFLMAPWYLSGSDEGLLSKTDDQARWHIDQYNQSETHGEFSSQPEVYNDELEDQTNNDFGLNGSFLAILNPQNSWNIDNYNQSETHDDEWYDLENTDFGSIYTTDNDSYFTGTENDTAYYTDYLYDEHEYWYIERKISDPAINNNKTSDYEAKLNNTSDNIV